MNDKGAGPWCGRPGEGGRPTIMIVVESFGMVSSSREVYRVGRRYQPSKSQVGEEALT